ncbi:hypothetical protein KC329_g42 [Hortaea werneckii]|nr:hypothetical protein KC329_g42 [Hortaea werneckii]
MIDPMLMQLFQRHNQPCSRLNCAHLIFLPALPKPLRCLRLVIVFFARPFLHRLDIRTVSKILGFGAGRRVRTLR